MRLIILTAITFMISYGSYAVELKSSVTTNIQREVDQSTKLQSLVSLSANGFKQKLPEVRSLLSSYKFSRRSIREREVQIREYLRLAVKAIAADDDMISDEYLYNAYVEFRSDFNTVMQNISLRRYNGESLTAADMSEVCWAIAGMQNTQRGGNDAKSFPARCPNISK